MLTASVLAKKIIDRAIESGDFNGIDGFGEFVFVISFRSINEIDKITFPNHGFGIRIDRSHRMPHNQYRFPKNVWSWRWIGRKPSDDILCLLLLSIP